MPVVVNNLLRLRLLGVALILVLCNVANAGAWWDQQWEYRKKIHLDTMAAGVGDTLNEVPVLIRLHTGNFDFVNAKADGSDLRFIDIDDQTPLNFHIEKYDSIDELAFVWVKLPRVAGNSAQNAIWMYYGNQAAAGGQDSGGSYDVNQLAVFHFGEIEGFPRDATAYANHGGNFSGSSGLPAIIGNGMAFRGLGDHLVIPKTPSLNLKNGFTYSAWLRIEQPQQNGRLWTWEDDRSGISIELDELYPAVRIVNGRRDINLAAPDAALQPGSWTHLAVTADPEGDLAIYLNGVQVASQRLGMGLPAPDSDPIIGAAAGGTNEFVGDLDEVNISGIARAPAWIAMQIQNQGPDGLLLSYGELEEGEGGSASSFYLLTVASNITIDGWIVIGILLLLGAWGTMIFIVKAYIFRQMVKENQKFMSSFKNLSDLVSLQERQEEFSISPLYRIYRAGCEDLNSWLENQQGGGKSETGSQGPEYLQNRCRKRLHGAEPPGQQRPGGADHVDQRRAVPRPARDRVGSHEHLCRHGCGGRGQHYGDRTGGRVGPGHHGFRVDRRHPGAVCL